MDKTKKRIIATDQSEASSSKSLRSSSRELSENEENINTSEEPKSKDANTEQPSRRPQRTIREPRQNIIWKTLYMEARERSHKKAEQRRLKSLASSSHNRSTEEISTEFRVRVKRLGVFPMQSAPSATQGTASEIPIVPSISRTQDQSFERSSCQLERSSLLPPADESIVYSEDVEPLNFAERKFQVTNGVEYAFYATEGQGKVAFVKLQPHQMKPKTRLKKYMLNCVVFAGTLNLTMTEISIPMKSGDRFVIKKGSQYQIENVGDTVAMVLMSRCCVAPPIGQT